MVHLLPGQFADPRPRQRSRILSWARAMSSWARRSAARNSLMAAHGPVQSLRETRAEQLQGRVAAPLEQQHVELVVGRPRSARREAGRASARRRPVIRAWTLWGCRPAARAADSRSSTFRTYMRSSGGTPSATMARSSTRPSAVPSGDCRTVPRPWSRRSRPTTSRACRCSRSAVRLMPRDWHSSRSVGSCRRSLADARMTHPAGLVRRLGNFHVSSSATFGREHASAYQYLHHRRRASPVRPGPRPPRSRSPA